MQKRAYLIYLMIILATFIAGCSDNTNENEEQTMEGIVAMVNGDQILLVEGLTSDGVSGLTEDEILIESQSAAYLVLAEGVEELSVGDKVKVWIDALDESDPAYGEASKVEVLEDIPE